MHYYNYNYINCYTYYLYSQCDGSSMEYLVQRYLLVSLHMFTLLSSIVNGCVLV